MTSRQLFLHDAPLGGVETTLPAHLIGQDKWVTQHNVRVSPGMEQVLRKVQYVQVGTEDIQWMGMLPTLSPGYGKVLVLTSTNLYDLDENVLAGPFSTDTEFRRWATVMYAGRLYFVNEVNALRGYDGVLQTYSNGPKGKYLASWFDHLVIGRPTMSGINYPNRVVISGLHEFNQWSPAVGTEADFYDFVEWQQTDYPYTGVTGLAKLGAKLIVYTPTAVIPLAYVGLPKIIQIQESEILTRTGNTYPWTLVALGNVHFFYDAVEAMFLAYSGAGSVEPIGEPVRQYMKDNLNPDSTLASKMYGYVDEDYREVWWPFCSVDSIGEFDRAVIYNYKYKRWYTASVEDIRAFCKTALIYTPIGSLTGTIAALSGTIGALGLTGTSAPRLFGSAGGWVYREELDTDAYGVLVPMAESDPVLESADFHYGDIRNVKENDAIVINATWLDTTEGGIETRVIGRNFLSTPVDWTVASTVVGTWTPAAVDGELNYPPRYGRVLRYRFKGTTVRKLRFSAYSDRVRVEAPEA